MLYDMILSIKPCYVTEIISGNKKYEFRKSKPNKEIEKIYIYETRPTKKIVGYFKYSEIIIGNKYDIWNKFKCNAGISKEDYLRYYKNSLEVYVYRIKDFVQLKEYIDPYELIEGFVAPQSYRYIKRGLLDGFICDLV